jgi:hypothetical protein
MATMPILLRSMSVGWWQALHPSPEWALLSKAVKGSRIKWQDQQKSLSCWT